MYDFVSSRFVLLPLPTIEKNLVTKVKTCEEKIKSIEVQCRDIHELLVLLVSVH